MENKIEINSRPTFWSISGWVFGVVVLTVGILNLVLVHPAPGIAYLLLSLIYFPPINVMLQERFNFTIPLLIKLILGIILFMFTLGVSDLGDMIDKL